MRGFKVWLALILLFAMMPVAGAKAASGTYIMEGADPSILREGGMYYSVQSDSNGIHLRKASTMTGLNSFSTQTTVWWKPGDLQQIWAPEIAKINNEFWIFFAASPGQANEDSGVLNDRHRTYALKSTNPAGPYTFMGKVNLPDDKWSIDTSFVSYNFKHYLVWSGWAGNTNGEQNIYIAEVDVNNPMIMKSGRYIVSQPREAWERKDSAPPAYVNEGPQPIVQDGRLIIAFSANGSWGSNYCLGYVRLKAGGDPLNVTHYAKTDSCKFQSNSQVLGPGHHSWVLDGLYGTGLMAYHGVPASDNSNRGWWEKRVIMYKTITWEYQNMWHSWENRWDYGPVPVFGEPLSAYARFEASNMPGYFIRHANSRGRMDANVNPYRDSEWRVVPGLADPNAISFESVNFPGRYLRHRNGEIWLDTNDGSALFKADVTWVKRAGLANGSQVSFESYNIPGNYLRHRNYLLYSEKINTDLDRRDATFIDR